MDINHTLTKEENEYSSMIDVLKSLNEVQKSLVIERIAELKSVQNSGKNIIPEINHLS